MVYQENNNNNIQCSFTLYASVSLLVFSAMTWCPAEGSRRGLFTSIMRGSPLFYLPLNQLLLYIVYFVFCPQTVGQPQKDEDVDVTVSSSVDCSRKLNSSEVASSVTPNPFISAFINPSTAGGPSPHQTHTILSLNNRHLNR